MKQPDHQSATTPPGSGYEKKDANLRGVLVVAVLSVIIVVVAIVALQNYFVATQEALTEELVLGPESSALRELRARETSELSSYGVIDQEKGIYRIPIEQAMKLLAEEAYAATGEK